MVLTERKDEKCLNLICRKEASRACVCAETEEEVLWGCRCEGSFGPHPWRDVLVEEAARIEYLGVGEEGRIHVLWGNGRRYHSVVWEVYSVGQGQSLLSCDYPVHAI